MCVCYIISAYFVDSIRPPPSLKINNLKDTLYNISVIGYKILGYMIYRWNIEWVLGDILVI